MIKRAFHILFGYKVIITFPDGDKGIYRAYLGADLKIRTYVFGWKRQVILQENGVVRGLWPNDNTKWIPATK